MTIDRSTFQAMSLRILRFADEERLLNTDSLRIALTKVIGIGVGVILLTIWLFSPSPPPPDAKFKFMHCPKCETEFPYNKNLANKPCSRCGIKYRYTPTMEQMAKSGFQSPYQTMVIALVIELNALMALTV